MNAAFKLLAALRRGVLAVIVAILGIWHRISGLLLGPRCRYYPSCSQYAQQALVEHGFLRGAALAMRRLVRCNGLFAGGYDPVPKERGR